MWTFYPDVGSELRLALVLVLMLTAPGWALVAANDAWHPWRPLQRWCLALGLSIGLYPVLYYGARLVTPGLRFSGAVLVVLLTVCGVFAVWRLRGQWRAQFQFDQLEWLALAVFAATLFTRFWLIRDQPYPASPDSLHHALLTQLTAGQGQLPSTMEPYFPIPLAMYHLGLYALSGAAQVLSGAPAHTSVLWVAQALNGLCGIGVYLALDRTVGRLGGLVGALVVGLLSFQPAWLSSWGRFTVVASGTVLPFAWLMTVSTLETWRQSAQKMRWELVWSASVAALLTAATLLLHFRVAAYYLPLLALTVAWGLWRAHRSGQLRSAGLGVLILGVATLLLISPALWDALGAYLQFNDRNQHLTVLDEEQRRAYFEYPWSWVTDYGARPWLWLVTLAGGCFGVWRRNLVAAAGLMWLGALWLEGNAYVLGMPWLAFTNMSAVLISVYLPIGLIIGAAAEETPRVFSAALRPYITSGVMVVLLLGGLVAGRARALERIEQYYFVTAADVAAMNWISENTPVDACFAVNTHFFNSRFAHGTDAGYWIPYFTQRSTTAKTMMFPLGDAALTEELLEMSRAAKRLESDNSVVAELRRLGVAYVYLGENGNFLSPTLGLNVEKLKQSSDARIVYQHDGVTIFALDDIGALR